jgi:large subunit ribosomal protein L15
MLHQLTKVKQKSRLRVGRGNGRRGTTAGRGTKGQKARAGKKLRPGFEGGRTPLMRILPKRRGLGQPAQTFAYPINVQDLTSFKETERITLSTLKAKRLVPKSVKHVKILAEGELKKKLKFALPANAFSRGAREKIEKAGGSIIVTSSVAEKEEKPKKQPK